jgi:hypothetical protein
MIITWRDANGAIAIYLAIASLFAIANYRAIANIPWFSNKHWTLPLDIKPVVNSWGKWINKSSANGAMPYPIANSYNFKLEHRQIKMLWEKSGFCLLSWFWEQTSHYKIGWLPLNDLYEIVIVFHNFWYCPLLENALFYQKKGIFYPFRKAVLSP